MTRFHSIGGNEVEAHYAGGELAQTIDSKASPDANYPSLSAGSATGILGDPETASWMERTTAEDGAALIESVRGNTLRWNQLAEYIGAQSTTINGVTITDNNDGSFTLNGTATGNVVFNVGTRKPFTAGHKELVNGCPAGGSAATSYRLKDGYGTGADLGSGLIETRTSGYAIPQIIIASGYTCDNLVFKPQLFDLTAMFGAGNEPATVAEFEAMFPEPYYPYDAGSLLPVRMTGVETVAADESWSSTRTIPASTYFPNGLRSAGSVRDELRADAAVTRVGERAYQSGDESDASVITDGTVTHYALATPTVTPIDPPLPLSYRVGAGGTERVMVADGTTSAPPIFVTRYPLDPADLATSIAPVDGPIAKTNHAVGELVMLGFALCKVTTAIATGEVIEIGTNVTRTTVAAEIAALS